MDSRSHRAIMLVHGQPLLVVYEDGAGGFERRAGEAASGTAFRGAADPTDRAALAFRQLHSGGAWLADEFAQRSARDAAWREYQVQSQPGQP
jgi:hypothetical protein